MTTLRLTPAQERVVRDLVAHGYADKPFRPLYVAEDLCSTARAQSVARRVIIKLLETGYLVYIENGYWRLRPETVAAVSASQED